MKATYSVNVGNIGNIDCRTKREALATFREYCGQSRDNYGRAAGEPVTLLVGGEPAKEFDPTTPAAWRKGTLERAVMECLADYPDGTLFDVVAFEMTRDYPCGGWSVNTPFRIASDASPADVLAAARGRWEVFKANYLPKARVSDIRDTGGGPPYSVELEVDCTAFLSIRPVIAE